MEVFEGGCFCGTVRFRQHGRPMFIHCCHCRDCQHHSGSAFAAHGLIEAERVELMAGEPVATRVTTGSGQDKSIMACPNCRSPLWNDYANRPGLRAVILAALDDLKAFKPDVHIFTRSKLPWLPLDPAIPAFEEFYDVQTLWPAESLARRVAVNARAEAAKADFAAMSSQQG